MGSNPATLHCNCLLSGNSTCLPCWASIQVLSTLKCYVDLVKQRSQGRNLNHCLCKSLFAASPEDLFHHKINEGRGRKGVEMKSFYSSEVQSITPVLRGVVILLPCSPVGTRMPREGHTPVATKSGLGKSTFRAPPTKLGPSAKNLPVARREPAAARELEKAHLPSSSSSVSEHEGVALARG